MNKYSISDSDNKNNTSVLNSFRPVTPCPVCGRDHDNDCREAVNDPSFILCHTHQDARKGTLINGYRCVKESNGHTASFKLDNSGQWQALSDEEKAKYLEAQTERETAKQITDREKLARELPIEQRNYHYLKILSKLELADYHKEKLLERGFLLEQIINYGFKTVKRGQWVMDGLPDNLPGFTNGCANVSSDGIAYPVFDPQSRIEALYYHPDVINGGGKYKPLSSPNNSIHINGEIPLNYLPGMERDGELWLVEGHGFKDKLAHAKHGFSCLAASGGQFRSSPESLAEILRLLNPETKVVLCPDGGDVASKDGFGRWLKTAQAVEGLGCKVAVAWWGQYRKKQNPDIDELENLSSVQQITLEQFTELHKEEAAKAEKEAKIVDKLAKFSKLFADRTHWKKFTPTEKIHAPHFEFPESVPDSDCVVAVKSGLGTGKTDALLKMIKKSGRGSILLGYRNNLLFQTIARGENYGLNMYHISDEDSMMMLADDYSHFALCLDSILRVDGYFIGKDIYIDEICSVLLHALNGGTLGNIQAKVIAVLSKALQEANRVFLLDGNLADFHVDFISKLCPKKQVMKIENTKKIPPHKITFVQGIDIDRELKKRDTSSLLKEIFSKPEEKDWIVRDSREQCIVLDEILKAQGRKGRALHAGTVSEEWAKEFLQNPDEFIKKDQPDYMIVSPTAESGVSVTINGYFTRKFSIFCGTIPTNSEHQMLFRLRDNEIPHYVFCPEVSQVKDTSTPRTYSDKVFQKVLEDRIVNSASLAGENAIEALKKALERQSDAWWSLSIEWGAKQNFEMDNLRTCLIHDLEEAGHQVTIEEWFEDKEITELVSETKVLVHKKKASELCHAEEFSTREEAERATKKQAGLATQRRIEKTFLLDRLPGIKETDIWNEDFIYNCHIKNRQFIEQQYRYWLLKHPDISQKRHENEWYFLATAEFFFSGRAKKFRHDKIWALKELGVLQFEGREYHKDSLPVLDLVEKLRSRRDLQLALNYRVPALTKDGKERLEILGYLFGIVGLKNQLTTRKITENSVRAKHYVCVPLGTPGKNTPEDAYDFLTARTAILEAIERRFTQQEEKENPIDWTTAEPVQKLKNEYEEMQLKLQYGKMDKDKIKRFSSQLELWDKQYLEAETEEEKSEIEQKIKNAYAYLEQQQLSQSETDKIHSRLREMLETLPNDVAFNELRSELEANLLLASY